MKGDFIMALIKCKKCSAEISDEANFALIAALLLYCTDGDAQNAEI